MNYCPSGKRETAPHFHALVPLIYRELRRQAHRYLREERQGHTQTTALAHEAYLRLHEKGPTHFENRAHFFAISAQLMRQILVDHARARKAVKRRRGCQGYVGGCRWVAPKPGCGSDRIGRRLELFDTARRAAESDRRTAIFRWTFH